MGWRFVISLIIALIVAFFALLNAEVVVIKYLFGELRISQALVILISAIFGAFTVMMLSLIRQMKLKVQVRSDRMTIDSLKKEVESLKNKQASVCDAEIADDANTAGINNVN
jgi:uncharacterized integral membrane protein